VEIDYVPISPKKSKVAQIGTMGPSGIRSKVRELRELSTGSRFMPLLPNSDTPAKNVFGMPRRRDGHESDVEPKENERTADHFGVRTAEEKKEILGGMLGNVDALVEGVRKAGIWGLG